MRQAKAQASAALHHGACRSSIPLNAVLASLTFLHLWTHDTSRRGPPLFPLLSCDLTPAFVNSFQLSALAQLSWVLATTSAKLRAQLTMAGPSTTHQSFPGHSSMSSYAQPALCMCRTSTTRQASQATAPPQAMDLCPAMAQLLGPHNTLALGALLPELATSMLPMAAPPTQLALAYPMACPRIKQTPWARRQVA